MKFLILATCVCMAAAAPQRVSEPFAKAANVAASPFVSAARVTAGAAESTYNSGRSVGKRSPLSEPFAKAANVAASPFVSAARVTAGAAESTHNAGRSVVKRSPAGSDADAPIVRAEYDSKPDGSFSHITETGNNIKSEASGELKHIGDAAAVVFRGQYSYTSPDGSSVLVSYVADENGYQPQSDSIPVAPPVPEAILRSLEYIAAHPYQEAKKL